MAKRKQTTPEVLPSKPWKLSDIKEHSDNPRTHPPEQIELLADIFRKFGPDQDIVVDEDGLILKGHGRKLAAIQAEMATFPVTQRLGLSEHDKHALRVSDNALADLSGWNVDLLKPTLIDMQAAGYDMELLGFEPDALAGYLKTETAKDIEKTPAPSKKPIVRPGELWELGDHRIICGDSTDPKVWARLYGGSRAAMTFTDPPYGVSYEAKSGDFAVIEGDHKRRDDLYRMLVGAFKCMAKFTSADGAFYIWHASSTRVDFSQAMAAAALVERQYLIWAKPSIGLGYSDYRWAHEPCFYASHQERKPKFYGEPNETTVWRVAVAQPESTAVVLGPGLVLLDGHGHTLYLLPKTPKAKKAREVRLTGERPAIHVTDETGGGTVWEVAREHEYKHPTQKPVELARRAIVNSSQRGEIVADGFIGSGTTIMAAEATGRRCFAIDLDPAYVEVCIERWQEFAGKAAMLDGVPFETVAKARRKKERTNETSTAGKSIRSGKGSARPDRAMAKSPVREEMPPA